MLEPTSTACATPLGECAVEAIIGTHAVEACCEARARNQGRG